MLNVPALSPLWLLPEYAAKYNVQIEPVMFQRFADARTALASGDLDITALAQDITLALGQGAKSMVGVAVSARATTACSCARARTSRSGKRSPARPSHRCRLDLVAEIRGLTQENGLEYPSLKIVNIVGGGGNYLKALQAKEIDVAACGSPSAPRASSTAYAQYPTIDHNKSKAVGGLISVLA